MRGKADKASQAKRRWNRYGDRQDLRKPRHNIHDRCIFCGVVHSIDKLTKVVRRDGTVVYVCQAHIHLLNVNKEAV